MQNYNVPYIIAIAKWETGLTTDQYYSFVLDKIWF